ncbi:NAD-dependent epimerase/dehydratase family protein [Altererythrobacter sp. Z27]|uniref:NAD-dependent epimerase/dehydratase family protein n=1 Tax=Altererythrobacter sp. Z27 TaxID=3461147 RepID=UPI004043E0E9
MTNRRSFGSLSARNRSQICEPVYLDGHSSDVAVPQVDIMQPIGVAMKVLIVGNMGYVGSVLGPHLRQSMPHATLVGFDNAYFGQALVPGSTLPERFLDRQIFGDARDLHPGLLSGFDVVVELAAVSNDPMGNKFESATLSINRDASQRLARLAAEAGCKSFVFASSCSVYGIAEGGARTEQDPTAPETAYARSKVETEDLLAQIDTDMTITALRFATACGYSPRLRLDLVLNDFVASALRHDEITVLSDGSPWRPLIDVSDMARAIEWAASRSPEQGGRTLVVNTGHNANNFQVRDLAMAVKEALPGVTVSINTEAPVDSRSYQVDFSTFARLAPQHQPLCTLGDSIEQLIAGMRSAGLDQAETPSSPLIRLHELQRLTSTGQLSSELEWIA